MFKIEEIAHRYHTKKTLHFISWPEHFWSRIDYDLRTYDLMFLKKMDRKNLRHWALTWVSWLGHRALIDLKVDTLFCPFNLNFCSKNWLHLFSSLCNRYWFKVQKRRGDFNYLVDNFEVNVATKIPFVHLCASQYVL